jgi:uncharacterized membrane protein
VSEISHQHDKSHHLALAGGLPTQRIEAFSDGVFAIALTLLILEVKIPPLGTIANDAVLRTFLIEQWPTYLSYVLSVIVIGIFWVAHHGLFHYIKRANRNLLWLNILYLLCVTFIPFPAALLGEYSGYQTSVVLYAATLAVTGILLNVMLWYATNGRRLVDSNMDPSLIRVALIRNAIGPVIYFLAIVISFIPLHLFGLNSIQLDFALFVLVPVLYIAPGRIDTYWRREHGANEARAFADEKEHG